MKRIILFTLALCLFAGTVNADGWLGQRSELPLRRSLDPLYDILEREVSNGLPPILGTWYHVDPENGNANNDGLSKEDALADITEAYAKCTTGDGDGIVIYASGTTAANTSCYLDTTLVWSKHGITVIGVCAPTSMFQRARITATNGNTTNNFADLIDVTGDNNAFYNLQLFQSADSTAAVGGLEVAGNRNYFCNVHVAGAAGATAAATHYSLLLNGGAENTFVNCTFGTDSVDRGDNASCEILLDGTGYRNRFYGCETIAYVGTGTAHGAVESADATSIGRHVIFDGCIFSASQANTGLPAMASWFIGTAPTTGAIIVKDSICPGYAAWDATAGNDRVYVNMPTTAASGGGGLVTTP